MFNDRIKDKPVYISLEQFYKNTKSFSMLQEKNMFDPNHRENECPSFRWDAFSILPDCFVEICFSPYQIGFSRKWEYRPTCFIIAKRDGKTEYELFENTLRVIKTKADNPKYTQKYREKMQNEFIRLKTLRDKYLVPFEEKKPIRKTFESRLTDWGYKTSIDSLKGKYLVFDVETNGIRTTSDDLLSLSIYDPSTGICYNRFFPLERQPVLLTTNINGIHAEDLKDETPMDQEELDKLIDFFDMKHKVLLSYGGGKGTFDSSFAINYCKRHKLKGFKELAFDNIKNYVPKAPFGAEGQLSKDNLCRLLGINGVEDVHTSSNDCLLEWKLFEKLYGKKLFFDGNDLFSFDENYIVPVSKLNASPELRQYKDIEAFNIRGHLTEIFQYSFSRKSLKEIKKFPTNITGITVEEGIDSLLNVQKQDNLSFLRKNKSLLTHLLTLPSSIKEVPVVPTGDGKFMSVHPEDEEEVEEVNDVTSFIISELSSTVKFIKEEIFHSSPILSQELSISKDKKVFALCDLSNEESVLEIKTYDVRDFFDSNLLNDRVCQQLYYEANGRNAYVLSMIFQTKSSNKTHEETVKDIVVKIYQVRFEDIKNGFKI